MQQGQQSSLFCMQTPLHLMKISHLSGQALGIINKQRGPAKPQVFTPTPVDHRGEEQPLSTELFSRQKQVKGEQEWQTWGIRHSQSCSCCLPSSCSTLPEDARGCAWPSRPIPAPASPDCRADGQQMPGSSTERGGTGWDAGFWAPVQNKHVLLAREPVIQHP